MEGFTPKARETVRIFFSTIVDLRLVDADAVPLLFVVLETFRLRIVVMVYEKNDQENE